MRYCPPKKTPHWDAGQRMEKYRWQRRKRAQCKGNEVTYFVSECTKNEIAMTGKTTGNAGCSPPVPGAPPSRGVLVAGMFFEQLKGKYFVLK